MDVDEDGDDDDGNGDNIKSLSKSPLLHSVWCCSYCRLIPFLLWINMLCSCPDFIWYSYYCYYTSTPDENGNIITHILHVPFLPKSKVKTLYV